MKTSFAALSALLGILAFSTAASACERHKEHKATELQAAITAPPAPVVEPRAAAEDELVPPRSTTEEVMGMTKAYGLGMGCARKRVEQTADLTH
jgi:hypothetical protein